MSDITMCKDDSCSKRLSCYRHTAPTDWLYQSVFLESPKTEEGCTYYWPTEESKKSNNESNSSKNQDSDHQG